MTIASFAEVQLDSGLVIYSTIGGPAASTTVATNFAGYEFRNINQPTMLGRWEYGERNMLPADFENLHNFFHARYGKGQGFRYRDWGNYKDKGAGAFSVIDSTHSQMIKNFTSGSVTAYRIIKKPISSTIAIQGSGSYTFDTNTGIVTITSGAAPTGWTGQFDTPVRFDADDIKFEFIAADIVAPGGPANITGAYFHLASLPIIELRNP